MRKRLMLVGTASVLLGGSLVGITSHSASAVDCDPTVQGAECVTAGPALADFIDIRRVQPGAVGVRAGRGSFISVCGRNQNGHHNSDNHIVAPGVSNGAHHIHDYVGNLTTDAFSTDESLAAGGTTCRFGDRSTYFWPAIRIRQGQRAAQNQNQNQNNQQQQNRNNRQQQGQNQQAAQNDQAVQQDAAQQSDAVQQQDQGQDQAQQQDQGQQAQQQGQDQAAQQQQQGQDNAVQQNGRRGNTGNTGNNGNNGNNGSTAQPTQTAAPQQSAQPTQTAAPPPPVQNDPGGASDGNFGRIIVPRVAQMQFRANAAGPVVAMPRFLRIITGDAKSATNGGANARAAWSCTGFLNRVTQKYPLCPRGSLVVRILDFPSCWDGQNTDSANHRTHVVFPGANGACPAGTKAIPQLRMTLAFSVPPGASYAVDAFPEQLHNPLTDHADFENVMPTQLMNQVVNCLNRGRRC